jgi:hypothetical protein
MTGVVDWSHARRGGGGGGGWYHCRVSTMSRSSGRSAVAAAAYRTGESLRDETLDRTHDYTRRSGVLHSYSLARDNAPDWAFETEALWNAAETRRNSVVARECELALPASISPKEREGIARGFAEELIDRYGVAVTVALHAPSREGDDRNDHAHIMWTTREVGPDGFGEKTRVLDDIRTTGPKEIRYLRDYSADLINAALERAGVDERVDARSFKDRGIDREPSEHLGPSATEIERQGRESERGDRNREIGERNEHIDRLVEELAQTEAAIVAEEERRLDDRYGPPGQEDPEQPREAPAAPDTDAGQEQGRRLTLEEQMAACDAIAEAEPFRRMVREQGEIPQADAGMSWWDRTAAAVSRWRDQARDFAVGTWQKFLERGRGRDENEPGRGPDREK